MSMLWSILFFVSFFLLIFIILRVKTTWKWLGYALMHVSLAAVLLYVLNTLFPELSLAINAATLLTVSVLGIPGLLLLAAVQWFVL